MNHISVARFKTGKFCYHTDGATLTIVVQDKPVYYTTDLRFLSNKEAEIYAQTINKKLGLSDERVMEIISSSIRAYRALSRKGRP